MTPDSWLEAHAYLRPIAELSAEVDLAAAAIDTPEAPLPDWEDYRPDFLAGVTLLHSGDAAIDLEPGGRTAAALIERLGVVPSYYLRYFYAHDAVVREMRTKPSRAAEVAEMERQLLALYADPALDTTKASHDTHPG